MFANCPLVDCRKRSRTKSTGDGSEFTCTNCGRFVVSRTLAVSLDFANHPELMSGLRLYIQAQNAASPSSVPLLHTGNWQQRAEAHRPSVFSQLFS